MQYANFRVASSGYFSAMKIPLRRGRLFQESDGPDAPHVALINETLARHTWPDENPIGKELQFGGMDGDLHPLHIIGVVADVRDESLDAEPQPTVYVNYIQRPTHAAEFTIVLRSQGGNIITAMRRAATATHPEAPLKFETLEEVVGASLVINLADGAGVPLVGVINEAMAKKYFHAGDPIGARIRWAREEGVSWIAIVGVVGDVRHFGLAEAEEPAIYTPYAQSGQSWKRWSEIVLRAPANFDRHTLTAEAKSTIWKVDPLVAVPKVRAMAEVMSGSLAQRKFNSVLVGAFAAIALLLATVGLYGVLAFSVTQRTREIGIRVAVGAQPRDVIKLVLADGLILALLGVGAGMIASLAGTRLLASLLYGLRPTDPATFAALAIFLIAVALTACLIPARRAARIDPVVALRYE
jgi:MacB-like periplasmic core domain/FtsX-like permease family